MRALIEITDESGGCASTTLDEFDPGNPYLLGGVHINGVGFFVEAVRVNKATPRVAWDKAQQGRLNSYLAIDEEVTPCPVKIGRWYYVLCVFGQAAPSTYRKKGGAK